MKSSKFFKKIRRKFPQLDWVDAAALGVFFIILVVMAAFFLRRAEYVQVTVKIAPSDQLQNPWVQRETPEWYIANLHTELEEKSLLGVSNIKVERVYYYPTMQNVETVFVDLKVRAVYNQRTQQYSYQGTPLLVGSFQDFSVGGVRVVGLVTRLNEQGAGERKQIVVRGNLETQENEWIQYAAETGFEGVRRYLADDIVEDLVSTDSEGNQMAKILEVYKNPAYRSLISGNRVVRDYDPERQKVYLEVLLTVDELNGSYFYEQEEPVFLGQTLEITFEDFRVFLTIEEIID